MITNTGKSIITKYLLGQTPAYASHIAIGCGTAPTSSLSFSVTNVATSTTTVTLTTSAAHNISTGDYITISGINSYTNGVFLVTSATSGGTTIQYSIPSSFLTVTTGLAATLISGAGVITLTSGTTAGLTVGQSLSVTSGTGAFGTSPRIVAINSSTQIIVNVSHATSGAVVFSATDAMTAPVLPTGTVTKNYANKTSLDFEMFRVPITSRGYVTETDSTGATVSKIVLTAQLPTEERYEITEFGVYPSNANPTAGNYDSKTILSFTTNESWIMSTTNSAPVTVTTALDAATSGTIATATNIFNVGSDNTAFNNELRLNRQERCRFYNNILMMAGNLSTLKTPNPGTTDGVTSTTDYVKINTFTTSFANNSPTDELRLAFSVINKVSTDADPALAKVLIKFKHGSEYAAFYISQTIVSGNRYYIAVKKLQDILKTSGFSWNLVSSIELYSSVEVTVDTTSANYYVALDALKLENTSSINPLYGLVGYTPVTNVVNGNARPIIKNANTSNFVEFRFVADVI